MTVTCTSQDYHVGTLLCSHIMATTLASCYVRIISTQDTQWSPWQPNFTHSSLVYLHLLVSEVRHLLEWINRYQHGTDVCLYTGVRKCNECYTQMWAPTQLALTNTHLATWTEICIQNMRTVPEKVQKSRSNKFPALVVIITGLIYKSSLLTIYTENAYCKWSFSLSQLPSP